MDHATLKQGLLGTQAVWARAMGYPAFYFQHAVQHWFDQGWLKPGHRLIDFGSQEFVADPPRRARPSPNSFVGMARI